MRKQPLSIQSTATALVALLACFSVTAFAHGVSGGDQGFLESSTGTHLIPFLYLGAKHMVTGYDHLLFLLGVIFFLYRARDVALYVTLFSIGHSVTLLFGVLSGAHINPYIVDAIIGLSVVYKGFDNIGGFRKCFGFQPNTRWAVLLFGLVHGFGLATKLQDLSLSEDGLIPNMIAFNIGVEVGQLLALGLILIVMTAWRQRQSFNRHAFAANVALMCAGFLLTGYQMVGFMIGH
ncbi:MAG: hypothetical protein CMH65_12060 [Nevskiales bacterium]|uniref:HupE/UreJ family protein n=1 Tax=Abyssibacter profundi TaxID=2182787 RepID=A0A383XPZ6_9GAMM|nr:hypothetical protein [Nevskiales bacterium]PWN54700.1 hypothetical protein DEH80_15880 [Abyssibacter profundi]